jgi:hypothetical protein
MEEALKVKRIPFHPAFGYASESEFSKLAEMKAGKEYASLRNEIDKRSRHNGKTHRLGE